MKKEVKPVIVSIVGIVIILGCLFLLKGLLPKNNVKENDKSQEKTEEKVQYHLYELYDYDKKVGAIYDLKNDLSDEILIENVSHGYDIYEGFIYYIDVNNIINKYDINNKTNESLNAKISDVNFSTTLKVYNNYIAIMTSSHFYAYYFETGLLDELNIKINNYSFLINDKTNELYYVTKSNNTYSYNLLTKENKLFMADCRPIMIKNDVLYFSTLDNDKYYLYNFNDETYNEITYTDFLLDYLGADTSYIIKNSQIRKVTKTTEELVYTLDNIYGIGYLRILKNYIIFEGYYGDMESSYYIYDINKNELNEVNENEINKYYSVLMDSPLLYIS